MKQTILVTGASSGIGLLIANRLHNSGHRVIGTSRNPDKHESDVPFKLLPLDISDETSIQSFREALFNQIDRLDVLINNAGYLVTGLAEETSVALGKQQFETNFWGTVRLTTELLTRFQSTEARENHHNRFNAGFDGSAECRVLLRFEACTGGIF